MLRAIQETPTGHGTQSGEAYTLWINPLGQAM